MARRFTLIADTRQIARSVAVSAVAIALSVYAMFLQNSGVSFAVLAAVVLLVSAGAVLQVSRAARLFDRQQQEMRQAARRAEDHYFKVLRRVLSTLEAREDYTRGRSKRIGLLARRVAERMGLEPNACHLIDLAGQVHDIGMLSVPEHVLNKPAVLGASEFRTVRRHAEAACRILKPLAFLGEVLPAIRHHHERMNGTGYPGRLRGEQIPLAARILAVADAFDAMTHDRPYRPALADIEALDELRRCSPQAYDPACVTALEEIMNLRQLREANGLRQETPAEFPAASPPPAALPAAAGPGA